MPGGDHLTRNNAAASVMSENAKQWSSENSQSDHSERTLRSSAAAGFSFIGRTPVLAGAFLTDVCVCATFFGLPGTDYRGQGPIIGETLNLDFSRPNWYMTSATRWIRTLSIAVG
jgi:hypothetical protein